MWEYKILIAVLKGERTAGRMKERYLTPATEIELFDANDIVTTSWGEGDLGGDDIFDG